MVRLKLIIFSFLVSSVAYPFNYDSLWVHNNNSAVDSELISTQIKLTYDILDYVSASQALPYARRICSIAKKRNSNREIVNANTLLGIVFLELNRTDTAYAIFKANYDLSKKINYVNGVNKSCGNLASTLMEIEDHRNAIIYIIESLEIYKDLNDSLGVAKRWLQMARLYSVQGQKMEADSLARLALNFSKRLRSNRLIANCFNALYLINDDKSRLDSTLFYFEQAIYYHQSYGDSFSVIRDKINMSDFFYKQGRFKEAEDILDRIFKQPNQVNQLDYATTQLMLSRIKLANGKYDTAGDILGRLDTTLLNVDQKVNYFEIKGDYYEKTENFKKSLVYFKLAQKASNKLEKLRQAKEIKIIQTQFKVSGIESQMKLQQSEINAANADLAREKQFKYMIGLIFLILAGFSYFLFQRYKQRQKLLSENEKIRIKNDLLELEQKLLLTQMNPHFIFNSLNSIKYYILKNESMLAADYLSDFAHLMRMILDSSRQELISLEDEKKILEYYLKLERVRLKDKFEFDIQIDDELEQELGAVKIPPMLFQPFVENAVKHGFENKNTGGRLKIFMDYKDDDIIEVKIIDDGGGRKASGVNKSHKSHAIDITSERVTLFNQSHHKGIHFRINDLKENDIPLGTEVIFELPLIAA